MKNNNRDSWGIRKRSDKRVAKVLRDCFACENAVQVATTEAIARLLERKGEAVPKDVLLYDKHTIDKVVLLCDKGIIDNSNKPANIQIVREIVALLIGDKK